MTDRSTFLATAVALAAAAPPGPRVPRDREPTEAPAARFVDVTATALDTRVRVDLDRSLAALAARTQRELAPDSLARRGLAVGDVDGDGREDLFVCQPGGVPDLLLVQRPAGGFEERAAELRLDLLDDTAAALWVDLDGDGDLDLVTALGAEVLVHEQRAFRGARRFGLRAALRAFGTTALCAADVDGDGDLDLLACGSDAALDPARAPEPADRALGGRPTRLFLNAVDGEAWSFEDATLAAGLGTLRGFASAASFEDLDRDGDPDLVHADRAGPLRLLLNEGGRFEDRSAAWGLAEVEGVAALDWVDLDLDGREELIASGRGGILLLDPDGQRFEHRAPVASGAWSATLPLAADGGALLLLGVPTAPAARWPGERGLVGDELTGSGYRAGLERALFARLGLEGAASDPPQPAAGAEAWLARAAAPESCQLPPGLEALAGARALAELDLDGDGVLDLVASRPDGPRLLLLRRAGPAGRDAISLRLVERGRDAVGARLELHAGSRALAATLRAGSGFTARSSRWLRVDAGRLGSSGALEATVHWPDGSSERFAGLVPGRLVLERGSGRPVFLDALAAPADEPAPPLAGGPLARPDRPGALLAAPATLPPLPALDAGGAEVALGATHSHPRLVLFGADASTLAAELRARRQRLGALGLEVVWLAQPDRPASGSAPAAHGAPQESPWCAPLSPTGDTAAVLDDLARLALAGPATGGALAAVLIDPGGRLRAVYPAPARDAAGALADAVSRDLASLDADPASLRDAAAAGSGRWHATPPRADLPWLADRLRARGHAAAGRALEVAAYETRELTHESMRTETALVRLRQGDPVEALKHLRVACELAPDFAPALALRGRVQLALGHPDEALDDLERALHLRPLEPRALEALSRAYDLLGVEATARALESLGRLQDPAEVARLASAVRPDHATPEAPAARAPGEERPR